MQIDNLQDKIHELNDQIYENETVRNIRLSNKKFSMI